MRLPMMKTRITRGFGRPKFPRMARSFQFPKWPGPCLQLCSMGACKSMIQRQFFGVGVLTLASVVAAACGSVQSKERSSSVDPVSNLLASAGETAESLVSKVAEAIGTPVTKPASPSVAADPVVEPSPVRRSRSVPAKPTTDAPVETAAAVVSGAPAARPAPVPLVEAVAVPVITKAQDYTVYSASDTDVVPPTPPVASGLRPWRMKAGPSVEVIVGSDGTVEKVQVLGTTRMSDAMVLSHVKAWKFAPALRAGDPVRYRLLLDDPVVAP